MRNCYWMLYKYILEVSQHSWSCPSSETIIHQFDPNVGSILKLWTLQSSMNWDVHCSSDFWRQSHKCNIHLWWSCHIWDCYYFGQKVSGVKSKEGNGRDLSSPLARPCDTGCKNSFHKITALLSRAVQELTVLKRGAENFQRSLRNSQSQFSGRQGMYFTQQWAVQNMDTVCPSKESR